ncbi:MAG: response regulator [Anaerolineae bacterium]|nr:response regulator [Anaerolineae bacterium]
MSTGSHPTILIVEDDLNLTAMLQAYFSAEGYRVLSTAWGEKAVTIATGELPDLVMLDISLPDIDGFEVCRRLRESHRTRTIPVVFFTERSTRTDRLQGLGMDVIDYITKPFDIHEMRLRIRNILARAHLMAMGNHITGLPEGTAIEQPLEALLHAPEGYAVMLVTLAGIDAFREMYGFVASNDVLRVTAVTLAAAVREIAGEQALCGHLDDHALVIAVPRTVLPVLEQRIYDRLAHSLEYFYPADNRGYHAHAGERLALFSATVCPERGQFGSIWALYEYLSARKRTLTGRILQLVK